MSYEFVYVYSLIMMPVYSDYEQSEWKKEIVAHGLVAVVTFLIYANVMTFFYLFLIGPKKFKKDRQNSVLEKIQLTIERQRFNEEDAAEEGDKNGDQETVDTFNLMTMINWLSEQKGKNHTMEQSTEESISDVVNNSGNPWQLHRDKDSLPRLYSFYTGLDL